MQRLVLPRTNSNHRSGRRRVKTNVHGDGIGVPRPPRFQQLAPGFEPLLKVFEIGIVLFHYGTLTLVFNNLVALFSQKNVVSHAPILNRQSGCFPLGKREKNRQALL